MADSHMVAPHWQFGRTTFAATSECLKSRMLTLPRALR
jgi:hypothetical protein